MANVSVVDIIELAIDATLDADRWYDVCDLLDRRYGGTSFLYSFDLREQNNGRTWFTRSAPSGLGALMKEYEENTPLEEAEANAKLMRTPPHVFLNELEYFNITSDAEFPAWRWRDAMRGLLKNQSRVGGKLNDAGPWLDVVAMHLPQRNQDIPLYIGKDFDLLFPVLSKTIEMSRVLRALLSRYTALLEVFDTLRFGAAFLNTSGQVVVSNDRFRAICSLEDALKMRRGIVTSAPGDISNLEKLLNNAHKTNSQGRDLISTIRKRSGGRPLVLKASLAKSKSIGEEPYVLLLVFDPDDDYPISSDGLAKVGNLTDAEAAICQMIVQGFGIDEISERRETSRETVRTQVKAVQAKLDCRSRLDLLRAAMATSSFP